MNQNDGSSLLGTNDPQAGNIGIIYVAPNDDRRSVLTAIFTQDKLGRKQVAVVLPEQNKAFQHAEDFDGLKHMRRGLKTQIVFIAPNGPGPAELARQRRFPVYSSLDNYAQSLKADSQASASNGHDAKGVKRGWSFGRKQKTSATNGASAAAIEYERTRPLSGMQVPVREPALMPIEMDTEDDYQHAPGTNGAAIGGAALGGAALASNLPGNHQWEPGTATPMTDESWDDLPPIIPVTPSSPAVNNSIEESAPVQVDAEPLAAASSSPGTLAEPTIISFPQPRQSPRTTDPLPKAELVDSAAPAIVPLPVAQSTTPTVNSTTRQRNGPRRAGAVGAAGGVAAAGTVAGGGGPPGSGSSGGGGGGGSRGRGGRAALVATALVLLTALLIGGIALAAPGGFLNRAVTGVQPSATVSITPASQDVPNTYKFTAVTGTLSGYELQAKVLKGQAGPQSAKAQATGSGFTKGTEATGTLTFINGAFKEQTVLANTAFPMVVNGVAITIYNDSRADIPAAVVGGPQGTKTVPAHVGSVGTVGNLGAGVLNQTCCSADGSIFVKNNTFSGGTNPQSFTIVQQSDIVNAYNTVKASLVASAENSFKAAIPSGFLLVGSETCTPYVSPDHPAGSQFTSVTVSASVICTGEVYDAGTAQSKAAQFYESEASIIKSKANLATPYELTGKVKAAVDLVKSPPTVNSKGVVTLSVVADGLWVYSKDEIAKLEAKVAGMKVDQLNTILTPQNGVASYSVPGGITTLPSRVTFSFVPVAGYQQSPIPVQGPITPIVAAISFQAAPTQQPGLGGS